MQHLITIIRSISLVAAIALSTHALAAQEAEYYVWIDENGVTNYSERSPQGVDAVYMGPQQRGQGQRPDSGRPGAVQPESDNDNSISPTSSADEPKNSGEVDPDALVAQERQEIAAQIAETKRQNCEIGKRNLAQLTAFSRIRVEDGGQERVLTEQERQSRIQEARDIVRNNCQG